MDTKTNRSTLIIALAVFVIPFAAALALHKTGLYKSAGTTNRGELIIPPVAFGEIALKDEHASPLPPEAFQHSWWMVYVMPQQCDTACSNSLYQLRQIRKALGPDMTRVSTLLIATDALPADQQQRLANDFPDIQVAYAQPTALQQWFAGTENTSLKETQSGYIYFVDTMGAVFMYYPTFADEQRSIQKGRDMLKDLQKVLKLSKIG